MDEILKLEIRGRIADGWKKIGAGVATLNKLLDDMHDPQGDLFPIKPESFHDDFVQVVQETRRIVDELARRTQVVE